MSVFLNHKKVQLKEGNPLIYNINIDILDLSHALCAGNEVLFYFLFWFSEIMFKSEIKIVS